MAIVNNVAGVHRTRAGYDDGTSAMSRVIDKDEELGKRDDEYHRRVKSSTSGWLPARPRKRRLLVTCVLLGAVWLLFRVLPETEAFRNGEGSLFRGRATDGDEFTEEVPGGVDGSSDTTETVTVAKTLPSSEAPLRKSDSELPAGAPPRKNDPKVPAANHYYNEVIKFYSLGKSLHKIGRTMGHRQENSNVLFAASRLKSLSAILPLACEMRRFERNHVHVAVFGRDDLTLEEIWEINGLKSSGCDIHWHDARPDFAPYSTELRAETAARSALRSINEYMHPQVIITDELMREEPFFQRAIDFTAREQGHPIIQIPGDAADRMTWITRLDTDPLRAWHTTDIEVVVHAPPDSVGTLKRLIRSLESADYTGVGYPRLTLEIPPDVSVAMQRFLEQIRWPPRQQSPLSITNLLTIRHRVPTRRLSTGEASVRFVESFWPHIRNDQHVFVVSPNAQLSPLYYQYLKANVMAYKHSGRLYDGIDDLLGIALDVPSITIDGSKSFKPPTAVNMRPDHGLDVNDEAQVPFLWEAPSSGAALYFGDKWLELHSFIANRMATRQGVQPREKIVSGVYPAWLEYFLELARLRGYNMLYPALKGGATLATIHHEGDRLPEEFGGPRPAGNKKGKRDVAAAPKVQAQDDFDPFLKPAKLPKPLPQDSNEQSLLASWASMHEVLLFDGDIPSLGDLPLLTYNGSFTQRDEVIEQAISMSEAFRREYGGCANDPRFKAGWKRKAFVSSARDLFCSGEETDDDYYPKKPAEPEPSDVPEEVPAKKQAKPEADDADDEAESSPAKVDGKAETKSGKDDNDGDAAGKGET